MSKIVAPCKWDETYRTAVCYFFSLLRKELLTAGVQRVSCSRLWVKGGQVGPLTFLMICQNKKSKHILTKNEILLFSHNKKLHFCIPDFP